MAIESAAACMHAMLCSYVSSHAQIITTPISMIWQTCGDDDDDDDDDGNDDDDDDDDGNDDDDDGDGDDLHAHDDYNDPDTDRIRAKPVGSRRISKNFQLDGMGPNKNPNHKRIQNGTCD